MNELTAKQVTELKASLETLKDELERLMDISREGTRTVELDQPIGRLTRMDAIQQQKMATANRHGHSVRLQQVLQALAAMDSGRYGACLRGPPLYGVVGKRRAKGPRRIGPFFREHTCVG